MLLYKLCYCINSSEINIQCCNKVSYNSVQLIPGASRECSLITNQPAMNIQAETYGPGTRCVEHGRQWFWTLNGVNSTSQVYGGGCYLV